jgi:hypothetical protein
MKFLGTFFSILTILTLYISVFDQKSEIFVRFMLYQSKIPIPIWLVFGMGALIFFLLVKRQPRPDQSKPEKKSVSEKSMENSANTSIAISSSKISEEFETKNISVDEKEFIHMIEEKIQETHFPSSAKILIDAKKNIPFTLVSQRSTPQQVKRDIEEFASFLTQIPVPQRVFFQFEDLMKSGIPIHNIVRGGLQKHVNISEVKITSQQDGVDVRFLKPQEPWISKPNLKRRFE